MEEQPKYIDFVYGFNVQDYYWFQIVGQTKRHTGFFSKEEVFEAVLAQVNTNPLRITAAPIKEPEFYSLLWDKE